VPIGFQILSKAELVEAISAKAIKKIIIQPIIKG
jgi:hypothetical protein